MTMHSHRDELPEAVIAYDLLVDGFPSAATALMEAVLMTSTDMNELLNQVIRTLASAAIQQGLILGLEYPKLGVKMLQAAPKGSSDVANDIIRTVITALRKEEYDV